MCRSETYSDSEDNTSEGNKGVIDMTKFRSAYLFVSVKENISN